MPLAFVPKLADTVYVTLPPSAGTVPLKLKVAVIPEKAVVVRVVPLLSKAKLVMSAGIPVPETVRVTADIFTVEGPGLINTICWAVTPEDPATWVELAGGFEPCDAETVTIVGVQLGVLDNVAVAVEVAVFANVLVIVDVGVLVMVRVGVELGVGVAVFVAVEEGVAVLTSVFVAVKVGVRLGVEDGVWVAV